MATDHEYFMEIALQEADLALKHGDVPIGALCVYNNQIVSQRHNEKEMKQDATAHAEILALRDASAKLGRLYLEGVTLYSTLEPCPMCAGSLVLTRCTRVVFGAFDLKGGATSSLYNLCCDPRLNFEVDVVSGILEQNCAIKLSTFFSQLRSS